jgi:two-component system invasion response regulator UvrY
MEPKARERITVLVVDDHRAVAEAIGGAMSSERGLAVSVAWSGEEALDVVRSDPPHVILMDVAMPGMGGLEAARRILEVDSDVKVIMLSAHDDDLLKARALETGASGYLSKISPMDQLVDAVRKARRGEPLHDQEEIDRLERRLRKRRSLEDNERERVSRLSTRETEILQLMAEGLDGQAISDKLGITYPTVRTHTANALTKLGVHSKTEAVVMAIRHGKVASDAPIA